MTVYLSSPQSQMQAAHLAEMPVLLSFGADGAANWLQPYVPTFRRLLIDSGAFSVWSSGKRIDLVAYAAWAEQYAWADGVAALDDVAGDWKQGLRNWNAYPWMFPTFHNSDPDEALDEILARAPRWLGLGMVPPRDAGTWLERTLERIPPGIHVHGWALRAFSDLPRLDSFDSTNWFLDTRKVLNACPWLTPSECTEIIVKRYQREKRMLKTASTQTELLYA